MKKKIFIALFSLAITLPTVYGQFESGGNNYLVTNISYSFFGTGDISGSALGLSYTRMLTKRLGFQIGYSKATGQSDRILGFEYNQESPFFNVTLDGDKTIAFNMASYHSYSGGIAYRVTDGNKSTLLVAAGANFQRIRNNYINQTFPFREGITDEEFMFIGTLFNSKASLGFHVTFDYLFFVVDDFSIGLHGSFENTENVLTNGGISFGYRF